MKRRKIAVLAVLVAVPAGVLINSLVSEATHGSIPVHGSQITKLLGNKFIE